MSGNARRPPIISARRCTAARCRCDLCGTPGPYDPVLENYRPRDVLAELREISASREWKRGRIHD